MQDVYPPGIPDDRFIHGKIPLTKPEERAVTMSKARLRPNMRVLDIGAGSGGFTVEAALLCPQGEVVAVERDAEALDILRENITRFELTNVMVVAGEAPEACAGMAPFHRELLGGFGGRIAELLAHVPSLLLPGGRVVASTIGLESSAEVIRSFRAAPWVEWEVVQLSVARGVPVWESLTGFEAMNPVWIASAGL